MKFRSFLIVACMVVVPLIAMFSHRIPTGTRAAVLAFLRDLAGPRPATASVAAVVTPVATPAAATAPAALVSPAVAQAPPVSLPVNRAAAAEPSGATPRVVPVAAAEPEVEACGRLRALGAVAIDCRPLAGHVGHVASCRVPVDGSGQLERVFQATGADAAAAAEALLRDVSAWKAAAAGATPTRVPRPTTMRF